MARRALRSICAVFLVVGSGAKRLNLSSCFHCCWLDILFSGANYMSNVLTPWEWSSVRIEIADDLSKTCLLLMETMNAPQILLRVALWDKNNFEALVFLSISWRKAWSLVLASHRLRPKVGLLHVTCSFLVKVC